MTSWKVKVVRNVWSVKSETDRDAAIVGFPGVVPRAVEAAGAAGSGHV